MKRQIEILAPAGSYESMRAAMNAGCDAVYMGGSKFGARAYADNPDEDTLIKAIDEAHLRNKRLYLTVNTLVKEEERLEELYNYLEKYYLAGLDAVIVQDLGVMHFIHQHFPKLPIHASTQTTITMAEGANLLKSMGITRLVTARELSFKEIKKIRENTDLEIETFVHGALCYCYSGQCLMSSMIGGRSGNRGRCAQPCRMPYQFFSNEGKISSPNESYLLSPKDINTIALIPDLIEAGVDSFKIEGRMKRPEYAAGVTYLYRKYVDFYLSWGRERFEDYLKSNDYRKDMIDLMDLYNRGGFSEGYGKTYHGKSMMSLIRPNHTGVLVGEVNSLEKGYANILLNEDINSQDILEIRNKEHEPVYEFTVKDEKNKGDIIKARLATIPIKSKRKLKEDKGSKYSLDMSIGYSVYRTRNNALLGKIQDKYINKDAKVGIIGYLEAKLGKKLKLTLGYNNQYVTAYHNVVEAAIKQPMTYDKLKSSIDKLGDTMFYFEDLTIDADEKIFVPVAWLNEIRRDAIAILSEAVKDSFRRTKDDLGHPQNYEERDKCPKANPNISIAVETYEQFTTTLAYEEISSVYADYDSFTIQQMIKMSEASSKANKRFYILLPHICRLKVYEKLKKDIAILTKDALVEGFIVKNLEEVQLLKDVFLNTGQERELLLNHNMYIFNRETKFFWKDKGIHGFTAPIELNQNELKNLGVHDCELMVYGYLPLMVSAQCLYASTKGCSKCQEKSSRMDYLLDRLGKKFYVRTNCNSCYNIIYNGQRLSLLSQADKILDLKPKGLRLDFTYETIDEMNDILSAYIDVFVHGRKALLDYDNITRGHFRRGVE